MKIKLIQIGKTEEYYLQDGIKKYMSRITHYIPFELISLPDIKNGNKMAIEKLKEEECKFISSKITVSDVVVLLDEKGLQLSSVEFSQNLQKKMNASVSTIVFVIGGAFGFSKEMYARSNEKLSISKMTFSHQMIRLLFVEQLYRALTILKGEKYHHD